MPRMPVSLYLHIPFCRVRCAYCDFNTYSGLEHLRAQYVAALVREVELVAEAAPTGFSRASDTIFFGGGTPSLLEAHLVRSLLAALRGSFEVAPDAEVTLEANPGTVDRAYLTALRAAGVNRLSYGVQSAQPDELRLLDRLHTFDQAAEAVGFARQAGFDNLNLDLIYGVPHQTLRAWTDTVARTLALQPDHLSLYALSLEHGTPMRAWVQRGRLPSPDPDLAADMYEAAGNMLAEAGFVQYEISNWARRTPGAPGDGAPLRACRHNLTYWRNGTYLGFGAGAHGCAAGRRYSNVRSPHAFVQRVHRHRGALAFPFSPAVVERIPVDLSTQRAETMMLGFRLTEEGVDGKAYQERFGAPAEHHFGSELRSLLQLGLIEQRPDRLRLAPSARLIANRVFQAFV
jgi:oxygen-independent coproporphyrinogen-3 oxidase